jgi:ubiquinone/menaquinone biosynthesis C-methylase UbiE
MRADVGFVGSIPVIYDRYLGPLIFEPYAIDLALRAAGAAPRAVLEIACGTGIATRALIRGLPAGFRIVATDLNQPMLDFAIGQIGTPGVVWQQADALHLPFDDGSFDAVVCQFGVMFFPDKVSAYREALRVLRPGGRFLFNVWLGIHENELAELVSEAVAGLFPGDPPNFLARTPHGCGDPDEIRNDLRTAGFGQVAIARVERRSRAASPRDAAIGYCQGTPLRNEIEARAPERLAAATDAAARAIAVRFGDGPIDAKMAAYVIEAER